MEQQSSFSDADRVMYWCRHNTTAIIPLLESVLTPAQAAQLETAMFPEPTDAQRQVALRRARRVLIDSGLNTSDTAVKALDVEMAVTAPVA